MNPACSLLLTSLSRIHQFFMPLKSLPDTGPLQVRTGAFVLFICFFFISACEIFETRKPEEPGTTTLPVFIQPERPQDVVQNLINAVRVLNLDHYRRCFSAESFSYDPSQAARSSNPEIWVGWSLTDEEIYFNNMRAESEGLSGHELRFSDPVFVGIHSEEELFEAGYLITVEHNRQGLPKVATGKLRLTIVRMDDGQWTIESWVDRENGQGNDFTWSDLRAAFL